MKILTLILFFMAVWSFYQKDYAGFALVTFITILSHLGIIHDEIKSKK